MNEHPLDDLISAYVDGELSPAETAEVEKLLADSAEARQLLEEFRALGASLRALPKLQLDPDFQERVLRQAERAALAGEPLSPPAGELPTVAASEAIPRFPRSWQSWKWAALATAAALMIWVAGRGPLEDKRQVAIAPDAKRAPETPLPQASFKAIKTKEAENVPLDDLADREAPAAHSDLLDAAKPARDEAGASTESLGRAAPKFGAPFREAPSPAAPVEFSDGPATGDSQPVELGIATSPGPATAQSLSVEAKDVAPPSSELAPAEPALPVSRFGKSSAPAAEAVAHGPTADPATMLAIDVVAAQPETASVALGEALLRNSIVLESEPGVPNTQNLARGGAGLNSVSTLESAEQKTLAADAALATNGAAAAVQLTPQPNQAPSSPELFAAAPPAADKGQEVWLYYVEASEGQLQKTLEDLRSQPQTFFSVEPVDVPADQQAEQEALVATAQSLDAKKTGANSLVQSRELDRAVTLQQNDATIDQRQLTDGFDADPQMRSRRSAAASAGGAAGAEPTVAGVETLAAPAIAAGQLNKAEDALQEPATVVEQRAQTVQESALQSLNLQQGRAYRVGIGQTQAEPSPQGGEAGYGMRGLNYGGQRLRYGAPAGGGYGRGYGQSNARGGAGYGQRNARGGAGYGQRNARGGAGYGQPSQSAAQVFRKQAPNEQAQVQAPAAAATEPPLSKADGDAGSDPQRTVRALIFLRPADPTGDAAAVPGVVGPQSQPVPAAEPVKAAAPE